jgi:hypothetical protein
MAVAVPALAEFSSRLGAASWFSVIGETLTAAEHADVASYMMSLGLTDMATSEIASWSDAEACIKATDWNSGWWDAEDRLRLNLLERAEQHFGKTVLLEALTVLSEQVSDVVHGAAAVAATRDGIADPGLIRAAAGAATMACHQAAVGIAADLTNDNPFMAKYRLFEAGHWPLCARGAVFYIF